MLRMIADALTRSHVSRSRIAYTSAGVCLARALAALANNQRPALAALAIALSACGSEGPRAPLADPPPPLPNTQVGREPLATSCLEGAVRPCHELLGEHDGIVSCYEGTETCVGGVFGACLDGESYRVVRGEGVAGEATSGARPLSFGAATDCTNNPCNSYCREFNEAPASGLVPNVDEMAPPLSSWTTGNISDYPPEWVVVGNREPCQVAGDCQFNTECTDPSLGSCSHSTCNEGESLVPGCGRCADTVCALNPDCCGSAPTCAHDPCEVGSGAPLDRTCDTCVEAVCAVHPECCDATWNDACVAYVATECAPLGQSCTCPDGGTEQNGACYVAGSEERDWFLARDACGVFGSGWSLAEINDGTENDIAQSLVGASGLENAWLGGIETAIDQWSWQSTGDVFFISDATGGALQGGYTYANWATAEPELGVVGRGIAIDADGTWLDAPLTFEFGYVCEGPKNRLGPKRSPFSWGPECVELTQLACGVTCPDGPVLGLGTCTARVPTDLDETCPTFDLAVGATCEAAGVPQIPVCNHGQTVAPAGLRLTHLPIQEIGSLTPDLSEAGDCVLSQPIPPGRCVTVTDCPDLVADRALVINPGGGAEDATECRLDDNWTIYQPLPCRAATCESGVYLASQVQAEGCRIELQNPLGVDPASARVTVGTGIPEPGCGDSEVRWGSSCYFFAANVDTWNDAQDSCRERGAGWDLVALNSPAENAWVRSNTDTTRDLQIGFNDKATENDHRWSNGSCRAFTHWNDATSQPNNNPPGSEQCARMTAAAGDEWEDKDCNDGEHPFVCEGPVRDARGGCAAGQIAGPDGSCYAFAPGSQTFLAAQNSCLAKGPGWRLVSIDDQSTNDFVTSLINCTQTWLNNPPGAFSNWKQGESVDLSNPPYIDELGQWHALADSLERATLCQGPITATGAPELVQVADAAACSADDEFYFTGNATAPETLELCPAACVAAAAVPGRRIEVEIPCAPPPLPAVVTVHDVVYGEADDTEIPVCPGTVPQWDFLYYDSITPADSRIEFEFRTAATVAELDADTIPFIPIASAHAVPTDTQKCEIGPQGSGCPIDLFNTLVDQGRVTQIALLQLRVRLIPGSSGEGPVVRDWKVRFSCPPAQ